jgi:hypothetical protein
MCWCFVVVVRDFPDEVCNMSMRRRTYSAKSSPSNMMVRQAKGRSVDRRPRSARRMHLSGKNQREPFAPPEDWYEPERDDLPSLGQGRYRMVVQAAGDGYVHVVTPEQVRARLAQVPAHFLRSLEVVQFSRMTRKKKSFPCYGMQWGATLYLYPLEHSLEEYFHKPPSVEVVNESKMYGGHWDQPNTGEWRLTWSQEAIEDYYLNNILIHELGHLNDDRNSGYHDRERYAEWFAIEYGYRHTGGRQARGRNQVRRRHHR